MTLWFQWPLVSSGCSLPACTGNEARRAVAAPGGLVFGATRFTGWQGQRESNPQPSVLETDALPIELCPCGNLTSLLIR